MKVPLKVRLSAAFAAVSVLLVAFIFIYESVSRELSMGKYLAEREESRIAALIGAVEDILQLSADPGAPKGDGDGEGAGGGDGAGFGAAGAGGGENAHLSGDASGLGIIYARRIADAGADGGAAVIADEKTPLGAAAAVADENAPLGAATVIADEKTPLGAATVIADEKTPLGAADAEGDSGPAGSAGVGDAGNDGSAGGESAAGTVVIEDDETPLSEAKYFIPYAAAHAGVYGADAGAGARARRSPLFDLGVERLAMLEAVGIEALYRNLIVKLYDSSGVVILDANEFNAARNAAFDAHYGDSDWNRGAPEDSMRMVRTVPLFAQADALIGGERELSARAPAARLEIGYFAPFTLDHDESMLIKAVNSALLYGMLLALLLSLAAGLFFTWQIVRPISGVVTVSKQIAGGNYEVRNSTRSSTREIQELIDIINGMGAILSQQRNLRRRITQDLAHEIKTPMSALQCQIEAILDGIWEADHERMASCHDEIVRISGLLNDLYKLDSYEDSDALSVECLEFDISSLIRTILVNFEGELAEGKLESKQIGAPFTVRTDRAKLAQILVNLISNAIKYTPPGGRVEVEASDAADTFSVIVRDTGVGVRASDLPHLFERLFRTDQSRERNTGGNGIGLAIVKALVSALDGDIKVMSAPYAGTEFTLTFRKAAA